jgi:hypothetical protein
MKKLMGTVLPIVLTGCLSGCRSDKDIQAEFVNAQIIKIDTLFRYETNKMQLTFQCQNNIRFVSFVPMNTRYKLGSTYQVLLTK